MKTSPALFLALFLCLVSFGAPGSVMSRTQLPADLQKKIERAEIRVFIRQTINGVDKEFEVFVAPESDIESLQGALSRTGYKALGIAEEHRLDAVKSRVKGTLNPLKKTKLIVMERP